MTETKRTCTVMRDEQGVALVICLLVMTLLYVLGATFLSISTTESSIASGRAKVMTAFFLADAGTEHARRSLQGKDLSGVLDGTTPVFTAGNTVNLAGGSYTIQVTNNTLANGFPLSTIAADPSASATVDSDGIVVVTSTATFENATQVAEAIVSAPQTNVTEGVVTGSNLDISGNPSISGSAGSVHSNGDMRITGNPTISQDATASGSFDASGSPTVGGDQGGGYPTVSIPPVVPADYRSLANYVLKADGKVYQSDGTTVVFDTSSGNSWPSNDGGWKLSGGKWEWNGNDVDPGANSVFYVEGNAKIASNPGEPGSPWQVTLIADGYIDVSGNPDMEAKTQDFLLIAGTDVKISGGPDVTGVIAAHEQFHGSGNFTLTGCIVVEDASSDDSTVGSNSISGNSTIIYTGGLSILASGSGSLSVLAWRQVF